MRISLSRCIIDGNENPAQLQETLIDHLEAIPIFPLLQAGRFRFRIEAREGLLKGLNFIDDRLQIEEVRTCGLIAFKKLRRFFRPSSS